MYDFSSYSFDASYWCLLHTLCAGGTLCVPSDSERHDNLTQSMRFYHTTDVFLTPATAKTVDPSAIPTLQRVFLGGEKVTADDLTPWRKHTEVTIVYGPAECSVWATGWKVPEIVPADVSIGQGVAQRTWIVNPMNHNQSGGKGSNWKKSSSTCVNACLVGACVFQQQRK
jgi:non-ribosomal peptide synthetase component F